MLTVHDLNFTYRGAAAQTLHQLDFDITQGEIFGFLGPSGAGKSTTQKILTGLLGKYQGQVAVFGKDLKTWDHRYFERIGVSFEFPNHYLKLTALENLNLFRSLYERETEAPMQLLEQVGLADDAHTRVSQFSKGMRMRLTFARALMHRPDLLFLDEPTAGLDPVNARNIRAMILAQRQRGATIFLTTHDMSVADQLCDRVAFIVDGRIPLIDSPRALKLRHGQRLARVEYHLNGRLEKRDFPLEGLADNAGFLLTLRQHDIETIHTQEATLEDIFITVTGRSLS